MVGRFSTASNSVAKRSTGNRHDQWTINAIPTGEPRGLTLSVRTTGDSAHVAQAMRKELQSIAPVPVSPARTLSIQLERSRCVSAVSGATACTVARLRIASSTTRSKSPCGTNGRVRPRLNGPECDEARGDNRRHPHVANGVRLDGARLRRVDGSRRGGNRASPGPLHASIKDPGADVFIEAFRAC